MAVNVEAPSLMLNAYRVDEKAHHSIKKVRLT